MYPIATVACAIQKRLKINTGAGGSHFNKVFTKQFLKYHHLKYLNA
jgi:hypothetical protein